MTQAIKWRGRVLELGLLKARGNGESIDWRILGDVSDDGLHVCTSILGRNMATRAKVEHRQLGTASDALPLAVAQVGVSNAELLESGNSEKGWEG